MAEELPWPGELAVIEAYGDLSTSLIKKAGDAAEKAFYALPDYRGAAQRQEFVGEYENILFGARLEAARLAIGFHQEVARVNGKKYVPPILKKEDFFPDGLRGQMDMLGGSGRFEPYQTRPFREVYKALAKGKSMTEAVSAGGARARILAQTDVQLARRQASLFARRDNDNIVGFIRVLTGAESCGLCYVASTQRYNKRNLSPIHPGCDCGELPIYGDTDPGRVIDQYNLDRVHEAFETRFGVADPGARNLDIGKFVEYKDGVRQADFTLVSVRDHGELGPVLTRRKENFTTLDDIRARQQARLERQVRDAIGEVDLTEAGLRSSKRQILKRLEAARNPVKIESIMQEALDTRFTGFGDGTNSEKYPVGVTREVARTVIELQENYPVPLTEMRGPELVGSGYGPRGQTYADANSRTRVLRFYEEFWTEPEKALEDFREASSSGLFPKWVVEENISPVQYITTHEYGHLVDFAAGEDIKPNTVARRIMAREMGVPSRELSKSQVDKFVTESLSKYSTTNRHEFIAEAFTDVAIRGDRADEISQEVIRLVTEDLQKKTEEEAFKIATQVTENEVAQLARGVASGLSDTDLSAVAGGDLGPVTSAALRAVRVSGLIGKKASVIAKLAIYTAQEIATNEIARRVAAQVQADVRRGQERAS